MEALVVNPVAAVAPGVIPEQVVMVIAYVLELRVLAALVVQAVTGMTGTLLKAALLAAV